MRDWYKILTSLFVATSDCQPLETTFRLLKIIVRSFNNLVMMQIIIGELHF